MPVNRNALIRYRTIDKCLQNRRRKWTIDDLIEACNKALYEYEGLANGVSLRTIRLDLSAMRSDKLGYNAPILVTDKKFYSYEDPDYSISNNPLSSQDLNVLQEVTHLLRQFKGFSHFNEVTEMVNKLEDKIYSEKFQRDPVIDFEKNELLTGLQWLDILYKAIIAQTPLSLSYQSFKARATSEILFYPYLLKEYRNRWFVLGMTQTSKEILTFALDRIQGIIPRPERPFQQHKNFDPHTYFKDIVGVTRNTGDTPTLILFLADHSQAPYIRTKPIHTSQVVVEEKKEGVLFSIEVIPNFELERELMGFGEGLEIISPNNLVRRIRRKVKLMHEIYT
ncbi:helix-turn-helix transcriptional regulator [Flavitalea flava]